MTLVFQFATGNMAVRVSDPDVLRSFNMANREKNPFFHIPTEDGPIYVNTNNVLFVTVAKENMIATPPRNIVFPGNNAKGDM
jgi:hypothetical protein